MIPILLVGYKRVTELTQLLRNSLEFGATRVYIAIDAIDSENDFPITAKFESNIAAIAKDYPDREIKVWIRSRNLGSSLSVISAIEWAFQFEETLAILEDDLEISEELLAFFSTQIQLLELDQKMLMISGSNPFRGKSKREPSGYSHYPVVWGWATTRGKWTVIRDGIFDSDCNFEEPIKVRVKNFLEAGRTRALSRLIDAWDVPLATFMRAKGYKCLIPNANLVSNIGYDGNATHTNAKKWPLGVEIEDLGTLEMSYAQNYDAQMESLILGVKRRHILSKIKLKVFAIAKNVKVQETLLFEDFSKIAIPGYGANK